MINTEKEFSINNRFWINPSVHTIRDMKWNEEVELEPRHMKLLVLLVQHQGEVVSRESIIQQIWNGYGGANEGLNQAISFLRKALGDQNKELIKTIPTRGYILNASLYDPEADKEEEDVWVGEDELPGKSIYNKIANWAVVIVIILITLFFIVSSQRQNNQSSTPREPPGTVIDTTYQYKEMKENADSTD